jgi:hypothetical protein
MGQKKGNKALKIKNMKKVPLLGQDLNSLPKLGLNLIEAAQATGLAPSRL